jgi:putative molybdopterin biosynthesis protein
MAKSQVENRIAAIRKSRGIKATDLAESVHVNRATIYAIEAGTYVPNTELALQLARELEVTVDELFSLASEREGRPKALATEVLTDMPSAKGQAVRACRVGSRWVSVPVSATPYFLPEADGVLQRATSKAGANELLMFAKEDPSPHRLVLAGCDPATGLLSRMVERASGVEVVSAPASSTLALQWLKQGKVHIAGSHLEDAKTGEFNLPFVRQHFPGEQIVLVTFARWEEGLVVAPGNPKALRTVEHLTKRGVRFINREPGSGSRGLLDRLLANGGIEPSKVHGYDRVAHGHLAAAYSVLSGDADSCLATRSAAQTFGLDFVALHSARYDLVMRKGTAELPAVKEFLDVLQRAALRRRLEVLAGYDTSQTGTLVAA